MKMGSFVQELRKSFSRKDIRYRILKADIVYILVIMVVSISFLVYSIGIVIKESINAIALLLGRVANGIEYQINKSDSMALSMLYTLQSQEMFNEFFTDNDDLPSLEDRKQIERLYVAINGPLRNAVQINIYKKMA